MMVLFCGQSRRALEEGAHFDAKPREHMAPMIIDGLVCCNAPSKVVLGYSATNGLFDLSLHRIEI